MKSRPTTVAESALARDLRKRGVLFDEHEFEQMQTEYVGLSISHDGPLPSIAFDLPSGGAAYMFNTYISNDSADKMLSPYFVAFDGPEWEPEMRLLPDPRRKTPRETMYVLNPRDAGYERESVLNHLVGRNRKLAPGETVDGFLLATGQVAIPRRYGDRAWFRMRLILFDQKGRSQNALFDVSVERGPEHKRMMERIAAAGQNRRKLFSQA